MCYSAQIIADYKRYVRAYGADIDLAAFYDLFWRRAREVFKLKLPKALEEWFTVMEGEQAGAIRGLIAEHRGTESTRLEKEIFKQRKRLADAERTLLTKTTKTALESKRIATDKVDWALSKLSSLRSPELGPDDLRIFPGHYAPVIVMEGGRRVVKPMRYQCRLAGKPAFYDTKFPGTYNARTDSLGGFWLEPFGRSHGILVVDAFYENVARHSMEHRALAPGEPPENVVLEFRPRPAHPMLVACLWSRWTAPGEPDLLSFAAVTDEPPPEIAAAGHDRCIVPIRQENVDAWLCPDPADLNRQLQILADRDRPQYEWLLAA